MSIGWGLHFLGLSIFLSVLMYLDHKEYTRGGRSIFFADKTGVEKKMREIQKREIDKKYEEVTK